MTSLPSSRAPPLSALFAKLKVSEDENKAPVSLSASKDLTASKTVSENKSENNLNKLKPAPTKANASISLSHSLAKPYKPPTLAPTGLPLKPTRMPGLLPKPQVGQARVRTDNTNPPQPQPQPSTSLQPHPQPTLTKTQSKVLRLIVTDCQNVFYSGGAGTGKSMLLRQIILALRKTFPQPGQVAVTAPTGIAAVNINGCTIHSFAGVGLLTGSVNEIVAAIQKSNRTLARWRNTKVLVIDEVSMVDGEMFDKLEQVARHVRGNTAPFGGIQLVVTGDFFQLPPVSRTTTTCKFAFEASSWSRCFPSHDHMIQLKEIFRQKDPTLVDLLNQLRIGTCLPDSADLLKSLARPIRNEDGLWPTELFATRDQVAAANRARVQLIPGELVRYKARDVGVTVDQVRKLSDVCLAPEILEVKVGVQVMLLKNIKEETEAGGGGGDIVVELVNGTLGIVVECEMDSVVVDFVVGGVVKRRCVGREEWSIKDAFQNVLAMRKQIPLMLSYAMSIHKSQGQTLERLRVDLGRVFESGQSYVALSRATSLDGMQVLNFDASKVKADARVIQFYKMLDTI